MITATAFRADYAEFLDKSRFPDSLVNFWLAFAGVMLNTDRFGQPAPFVDTTAALAAMGAGYEAGDTINLAGGTYTLPVVITVNAVGVGGNITAFAVTNAGQYTALPANPVGQQSSSGAGTGATFNLAFVSGPYTEYDLATELYIAHNISIERRALDEAAVSGTPGTSTGLVSAKSVDKVSVSYAVAEASITGMGDLNLTIYGTRLAKMIKMFGMGPLTIVGGCFGGWLNGPGWNGPIVNQGIVWDQ